MYEWYMLTLTVTSFSSTPVISSDSLTIVASSSKLNTLFIKSFVRFNAMHKFTKQAGFRNAHIRWRRSSKGQGTRKHNLVLLSIACSMAMSVSSPTYRSLLPRTTRTWTWVQTWEEPLAARSPNMSSPNPQVAPELASATMAHEHQTHFKKLETIFLLGMLVITSPTHIYTNSFPHAGEHQPMKWPHNPNWLNTSATTQSR